MPPRFHVIYLSLVALVCTLVGAKGEPKLAQNFEEIVQQIGGIQTPVDDFVEDIQDVSQIKRFIGIAHSCNCINTEEGVDQQCQAVTSCLDHVYSMTGYLSHFFDLIDEFLSSSRETSFNATAVKRKLENLQPNIINFTLQEVTHFQPAMGWQNFSCGDNIVNYTSPETDSCRLEITCTDEDDCNLESKLGIGLSDWLADMRRSMNKLANVTEGIQDLQALLDTCHVTSRTARSNNKKEKKGRKGKGKKKGQSKKERRKLERQRKKDARKALKAEQRAAEKAARKAEEKAARKAEKKQERAQQHNEK